MKRALLLLLPFALVACSQSSDPVAPVDAATAAAVAKGPPGDPGGMKDYDETDLVSDIHSLHGNVIDADLVNPWGLAFNPSGILWVSNNGSGTSTLYDESGAKQGLTVTIPAASGGSGGAPTGVVFNATADFIIPSSTKARFIFAGEDGSIAAWTGGTSAVIVATSPDEGAAYKSIAIASMGGGNFLYLTDFHNNKIDVFNSTWGFVSSFTDATIPAGYAPFGIHTINGQLWVTYAKQLGPDNHDDQAGPGNGFVDVFNPDGSLSMRFASHGSLNSPWAVVMAPAGFGFASSTILVGNFGDGAIGAYDASNGHFLGALDAKDHKPLKIDGLWDLTFGPGAASTTLFFSAGPSDESHGQVGTLTVRPDDQGRGGRGNGDGPGMGGSE